MCIFRSNVLYTAIPYKVNASASATICRLLYRVKSTNAGCDLSECGWRMWQMIAFYLYLYARISTLQTYV